MSARAALAATTAVVSLAALVPWAEWPLRRLAGGPGDPSTPHYDVNLDASRLAVAGRTADGTYYVDAAHERPLMQGNLKAVGQLYLSRALPVQVPARAEFRVVLNGRDAVLRGR